MSVVPTIVPLGAVTAVNADVPLPFKMPVKVPAPEPPWPTVRAVVSPVNEVISLFAPEAAALNAVRALAAVPAPVPPLLTFKNGPASNNASIESRSELIFVPQLSVDAPTD